MKNCRHCNKPLIHSFVDLGFAPPSNALLSPEQLNRPETYFPLRVKVCENCWLVQTEDYANTEDLFQDDYPYFSSTSSTWLAHAHVFSSAIIEKLRLDENSLTIEIASNDGYLLRNFVKAGIPCLGIEPTNSTADCAERLGIPVLREFFTESLGIKLRNEGRQADLIIGNNVYAHVPDINDFTSGLKASLKQGGTISIEFPHVLHLIKNCQFDTIYHEHFSYFSLHTVIQIFKKAGLRVWDVEELSTHGGSLRILGCHADDRRENKKSIDSVLEKEKLGGILDLQSYLNFQGRAETIKNALLSFLISQKSKGKTVVAYGAAAKGNTLLNFAGVKNDLIPFAFDAAPSKQGKFMPGSHIPILSPHKLGEIRPDNVLILPWNIADEIKVYLRKFLPCSSFLTIEPELNIL